MRRMAHRSAPCLLVLLLACACGLGPAATLQRVGYYYGDVRADDGVPIEVKARTGPAPTLVFVHGWMCNGGQWQAQVDDLQADFGTVVLDLPGHGHSGRLRRSWSVEGLAQDVAGVIEDLELEQVVLVGHSMGGPIALEVAALLPDRVIGVIAVDSLHDAEQQWSGEQMQAVIDQLAANWDETMQRFVDSMMVQPGSPVARRVYGEMVANDPAVGVELMRSFADIDLRAELRACPVPVRCINASFSMPTQVEGNRKYLADFDAVDLDGVGHFPQLENPARVNIEIRDAIADILDGPGPRVGA